MFGENDLVHVELNDGTTKGSMEEEGCEVLSVSASRSSLRGIEDIDRFHDREPTTGVEASSTTNYGNDVDTPFDDSNVDPPPPSPYTASSNPILPSMIIKFNVGMMIKIVKPVPLFFVYFI